MQLTEKEVSLLVDGLRLAGEKWKEMVDEAEKGESLKGHPVIGMLREQIKRAEDLKNRLIDADGVELI